MNEGGRVKKNIIIFVALLFIILLLIDRYYWAQISQWREDQAANIWLGYTAGIGNIPVGLISSEGIPNPNGMLILGFFLSILPSLLSISLVLGSAQILFLSLVGWKASGNNWQYFLLATIPALSSVILRSISVEYWNQYTITLVNIFFIFWVLRYLKKPSLWNIPPIVILILLAPSLYLAGVVNAIVMTIITFGMLVYRGPVTTQFWFVAVSVLLLVLLSVFLTWLPYFQNVSLDQIRDSNEASLGPVALFRALWESLVGIPSYVPFQWADKQAFSFAFKHADESILSPASQILLRVVGRAYMLQAVFAFVIFSWTVLRSLIEGPAGKNSNLTINIPALRLVTLSTLFIGLSFAISTWLGGPDWMHGKRPDQIVQFLPLFLFLIFMLPVALMYNGRAQKITVGFSLVSLSIFTIANLLCGFLIIRDHLQYRGDVLTEADVPLTDKMQAIDFIAKDWKNYSSSSTIPVDYDLGGGKWDWIPKFGNKLTKWYPAPMTLGRSFDYELLRRYGLTNEQESVQLRTFGNGRYLITYTFEDPPQISEGQITHHSFGRLRVSVVEK